ncbi:hypothetical protein HBH56_133400 [Parastagonospora nodorum]|uniref:2EXR domain-containing protein n=1 Tax=Phaeosphaeria nodorum (strain SN15 / ATCC MYA-4574 / FGSC 10173) TaxID=321614 RepID=A0A7U2I5T6_PHANO|nr:hypothetical protein HBH56_133400 [Parastagonospora nodorum]QRD02749.1 hypothetical protein JI435_307690 [Parastagonospora nodorum SN15]KAH3927176.1 hypothetical protein HBH54_159890 [Parastagonospora nodorum]KAH3949342.1 hypothetical protein HBH53_088480 [Parastagonospora nodorum]KAH3977985.1 hypothetical protein HBH51_067530 [Parastagonospora nodorum]
MGCAFSSVPSLRPKLAKNQCSPKEAVEGKPIAFAQAFHPFPRLPYELRRQIWVESLSHQVPRVYALDLDITLTDQNNDTDMPMRPTNVKFAPAIPLDDSDELRNLIDATHTSRKIGSTCREARDATAYVLPDMFEMNANPKPFQGNSQRPHISTGYFRFNAKRDIIGVLHSSIERLDYIRTWAKRGNVLPNSHLIRHVALDIDFTEDTRISGVWTKCGCGRPDCVVCSRDPLLDFTRLFPRLESFHLMQYSTSFVAESVAWPTVDVAPVRECDCYNSGQCIKHDWPLFRGMADDSWFISYTEDGGCMYPILPRLAHDRPQECRWPYYDALGDLDMRILRRVTLGGR